MWKKKVEFIQSGNTFLSLNIIFENYERKIGDFIT